MNLHAQSPWASRLLAGSALAAGLALVALAGAEPPPGPPPGPPPEAFTACDGKASGDACSVTCHDHTMDGTCATPPNETKLACRPNHPPGPPPEAFTACDGKASGDVCSVSFHGNSVDGVCGAPPGESKLACRPNRPPPPPAGG
jgi:hypothetical protein